MKAKPLSRMRMAILGLACNPPNMQKKLINAKSQTHYLNSGSGFFKLDY